MYYNTSILNIYYLGKWNISVPFFNIVMISIVAVSEFVYRLNNIKFLKVIFFEE